MPTDNYFTQLMHGVTTLMTENSALFLLAGRRLFQAIAVILLSWQGVQYALASASGASGFRFDRFTSLVMQLAFCQAMLVYYDAPLPGIGKSFSHLIVDQGLEMASKIETQTSDDAIMKLAGAIDQAEAPSGVSIFDLLQVWRYVCTIIVLTLAQLALFAVISWGFIAVGVCVLLGPIFIPFYVVPYLDFMFWGWFKSLLQYSFYPVVGNAVVYVFAQFLLNFFRHHPAPWDASEIAGFFVQIVFIGIAAVWGILKIPSLVSSIFSGFSGDHALPGLGWWR